MDNFVVSARKYRPSTFDTVVGQSNITGTLKNAISNNHLAQAFLFCGPRGVGKTSCARILAKTINCMNLNDKTEACNECESCQGFNNSHSFNIHELDGASNNGVDKIRELVDQVRFAPQVGKYSIYIIDEVHMLSQAAFNAFLKTLEEPPAHAIFILATTEKHKIIPTILSRCQIFDFKRIQIQDIVEHLVFVAKSEGIDAQKDALHIIAQKSDGALRDALSTFDQIVSFSGNTLSYENVIQNLNILDYDYYFKLVDFFLKGDLSSALVLYDEILKNGFDGHQFINGLAQHLRDLMVCQDPITINLLEVSQTIKTKYAEQSASCSNSFLLKGLEICNKIDLNFRSSKNQRLLVELGLMQINGLMHAFEEKKNIVETTSSTEKKKKSETITEPTPITTPQPKYEETAKKIITPPPVRPKVLHLKDEANQKRTISISDFQSKKVQPDESKEHKTPQHEELFEQHQLKLHWKNYCKTLQEEGKHNLHSILNEKVAELKNDFVLELFLDNKMQEEVVVDDKNKLLQYLQRNLKNDKIKLILTIKKIETLEAKAYTSEDKFVKMAEKNSALLKLKDEFGLEINY